MKTIPLIFYCLFIFLYPSVTTSVTFPYQLISLQGKVEQLFLNSYKSPLSSKDTSLCLPFRESYKYSVIWDTNILLIIKFLKLRDIKFLKFSFKTEGQIYLSVHFWDQSDHAVVLPARCLVSFPFFPPLPPELTNSSWPLGQSSHTFRILQVSGTKASR